MIKDILVNLTVGSEDDPAANYAISVAREFNAYVAGVAFVYDPAVPLVYGAGETVPAAWIDAERIQAETAAKASNTRFEEAVRGSGVSAESRVLDASAAGAGGVFASMARVFDFSVVRQADPNRLAYEDLIIEAALFESGRPVLVVPYIHKEPLKLDRVMVCWKDSRPAARAVADALPLLARAKAIEIVTIDTGSRKGDEIPGADMAHHLARHGLSVELKRIVASDVDVPNTILSHAADSSTDLIVMGAYGHSRLREFILGGATRGILTTMTVPTLMSH